MGGDLAIVGGGILGTVIAHMAAIAGFEPVVFRLSDGKVPSADSLRNQAWLQSGLRYARKDRALAAQMWQYGRSLHEYLSLPVPAGRGVFQVADDAAARELEADAASILVGPIDRLSRADSIRLLADHYVDGAIAIETPEAPFKEGLLIQEARELARSRRAKFFQVKKPIELIGGSESNRRPQLRVEGDIHEFNQIVLAAGAGNLPLLGSLGGQIGISLTQTPLLVMPGVPSINCPLLVDRIGHFSLIAHRPYPSRIDGCMVFAAADTEEEDVDYKEPRERKVRDEKKKALLDALPRMLRERIATSRITAGVEVYPVVKGKRLPTTRPYIQTASGYPDIIVAMPGRATLSLFAAEEVMKNLRKVANSKSRNAIGLGYSGWDSTHPIHMHHETYYEHLNDC